MKKVLTGILAVIMTLGMTVTGFAAAYSTPAEAAAGVTGRSIEEVVSQRQDGQTYGTIANEAGKLEEFKEAVLEIKEERLQELVKDGSITQSDADEILAVIKERQAICDGTGNSGAGLGLGLGGGYGMGAGRGNGGGQGIGRGNGGSPRGMGVGGMRLQDGSCYN